MEQFKKTSRTIQEETFREQKFWKRNQLWSLLLAAAVLAAMLIRPGLSVAPGAAELMLSMHDGSTETVSYSSITAAELLEKADYGAMVQGKETRTGKSGIWEHPAWGSYTLCVYASCDSAVRILTEDNCYVVNLPSEGETAQLYQLVLDRIPASR